MRNPHASALVPLVLAIVLSGPDGRAEDAAPPKAEAEASIEDEASTEDGAGTEAEASTEDGAGTEAEASTEARTSSLSWVRLEGAEGCLTAGTLAHAVEERLERKVLLSASEADLHIEGSIAPLGDASGFRARLRLTNQQGDALGVREVETDATDCSALDDELALIVSVMIDPHTTAPPDAAEPEPAPSVAPPAPEVPAEVIEQERIVVVAEDDPEPLQWELAAGVIGVAGVQPGSGWSFSPALVLEIPDLFAVVAAGGIALRRGAVSAPGAATAEAAFMHGAAAICPLVAHPWRLSILGCAGWLAGGLLSKGRGFDADSSGTPVITGPWLEGRVTLLAVGPVGAVANIGMFAPITRAELYYRAPTGEHTVHETAPVAGVAGLGLCLRMP